MPAPDYSQIKYKKVAAQSECLEGGSVIPNGQTVGILEFVGSGSEKSYSMLVFDYEGPNEKILATSKSGNRILMDASHPDNQVTGDGTAKLQIVLVNDGASESPVIGGSFKAVDV